MSSRVVEDEVVEANEGEEVVNVEESVSETETEAVTQEEQQEDAVEIPEKFQGKSVEDIVHSYTELEKEFGRKNNEMGELRRLTDQLLELQISEKSQKPEKQEAVDTSVDVDQLLDNPKEAISKIIESDPRLKRLEETLIQNETGRAKEQFETKHPDWQTTITDTGFQEWVTKSKVRTDLFRKAHTEYDYELANELFDMYDEVKPQQQEQTSEEKRKKVKKAAVETGGTGAKSTKVFRRADLINLRLQNPSKYDAMEDEIQRAYMEGRVR